MTFISIMQPRQSQTAKQPLAPVNQTLHIDTHNEPVP
jgi:hypothetical protein